MRAYSKFLHSNSFANIFKYKQNVCEMVLALLEPEDSNTFTLTTEDRIEMHTCDRKKLTMCHMSSIPHENVYFLLGCQEFIEVSFFNLVHFFLKRFLPCD